MYTRSSERSIEIPAQEPHAPGWNSGGMTRSECGPRRVGERRIRRSLCLVLLLAAVAAPAAPWPASAGQEVMTLATRPGVTMRVALLTPDAAPKGALVMFPGGAGAGSFGVRDGTVRLGANFLVRTAPQFVTRGFAVAIVDVPSDHAAGMGDEFRFSPQHAQDIARLIDELGARKLEPVYLVGTSRGTISAAYLGTALPDPRIKGLALTSSMQSLGPMALSKITVPVLVLHHRNDRCRVTPYEAAARLPGLLTGSPRITFVTVHGGTTPRSGDCEALSAHGYIGVEGPVVQVIADWAEGGPVPAEVGP